MTPHYFLFGSDVVPKHQSVYSEWSGSKHKITGEVTRSCWIEVLYWSQAGKFVMKLWYSLQHSSTFVLPLCTEAGAWMRKTYKQMTDKKVQRLFKKSLTCSFHQLSVLCMNNKAVTEGTCVSLKTSSVEVLSPNMTSPVSCCHGDEWQASD